MNLLVLDSEGAEVSVPNPLIRKFSDDTSRPDIDEASPSGVFRRAIINKGGKCAFLAPGHRHIALRFLSSSAPPPPSQCDLKDCSRNVWLLLRAFLSVLSFFLLFFTKLSYFI